MKTNYMDKIYSELIEKQNYLPVINDDGQPIKHEGMRIVQRVLQDKFTIVELLDADLISNEQISYKLKMAGNNLAQMGSTTVMAFQIFIFNSQPDELKLQLIKEGQMEDVYLRKYLPCIIVDLSNRKVTKLYNLPIQTKGLEETLYSMLGVDVNNEEVSVDTDNLMNADVETGIETDYAPSHFFSKVPFLTYGLIIVNVALWLIMNIYALVKDINVQSLFTSFGAKENFRILAGEYWRFLTPIFLHADFQHLLMNCLSLIVFGKMVEGIYGHKKFAFIYLFSGIMGNIASFMFSPHSAVGASGAIFGLMGAIVYLSVENPKLFKRYFGNNILVMVVISLVYGFVSPGIDNFGHIGGLVGGFLSSGIVKIKNVSNRLLGRPVFIAVTIIVVVASLYYGFNMSGNYKYYEVSKLTESNKLEEAEKKGEEIINMKLLDSDLKIDTMVKVAIIEYFQGKQDEAIERASLVKELDVSTGHFLFGVIYFYDQKYELAQEELNEAAKLNSELKEAIVKYLQQIDEKLS